MSEILSLTAWPELRVVDFSTRWIHNFGPLSELSQLTMLSLEDTGISETSSLSKLGALRVLGMGRNPELVDLSGLSALDELECLDVSFCKSLTALEPLSTLRNLRVLGAAGLQKPLPPSMLDHWPLLEAIDVDRVEGCPATLLNGASTAWERAVLLRAWWRDVKAHGKAPDALPVFILGSGQVGKTQVARRLRGLEFDKSVPSTHGIDLGLVELDTEFREEPMRGNLWDFGGQDVYHGTHTMFLDPRSVVVLAWTPSREPGGSSKDAPDETRSLGYWIGYQNSSASRDTPVIVVQTQCDAPSQRVRPPLPVSVLDLDYVQVAHCSAATRDGIAHLRSSIAQAAEFVLAREGVAYVPANWQRLIDRLRKLVGSQVRTVERTAFDNLTNQIAPGTPPETLLLYLRASGRVLYLASGSTVVLDVNWALEAIYSLFDRNTVLPLLQDAPQYGRFGRTHLERYVWHSRPANEHDLLLSLMLQARVCFCVSPGCYVAPAALPPRSKLQHQIDAEWTESDVDVSVDLRYAFLHDAVAQRALCELGEGLGERAILWRWGLLFTRKSEFGDTRICVEFEHARDGDGSGMAGIAARGPDAELWVKIVRDRILDVSLGPHPEVSDMWLRSSHIDKAELVRKLRIYSSYSHTTEKEHGLLSKVQAACRSVEIVVHRDKDDMRPNDWISNYMRDVANADLVIAIIDRRYLQSPYCMRELILLFETCGKRKDRFLPRLIPVVLENACLDDAQQRCRLIDWWKARRSKLDSQRRNLNIEDFTRDIYDDLNFHDELCRSLPAILDALLDTNSPRIRPDTSEEQLAYVVDAVFRSVAVDFD